MIGNVFSWLILWIGIPLFYILCWPALLGLWLYERGIVKVSGPRALLYYLISALLTPTLYAHILQRFL